MKKNPFDTSEFDAQEEMFPDEAAQDALSEAAADEDTQEDDAQVEKDYQELKQVSAAIRESLPLIQPKGITGQSNPQGLHRPSAPDEAQVRDAVIAKAQAAAKWQADLDRAAADQLKKDAPVKAHFRGNDPATHEALYAYKGETLKRSEIPAGVEVETIAQPARMPVV